MKGSFEQKNKPDIDPKDPRFKITHREALIGLILVIINFAWWYGFAYGLGSKPVSEYTYIFGLPAWFFYSCVVGFLVMVVLVIIAVKGFFKEVPFEDEEGESK
ncbi:YhdT family protein [Alkalihalophilus marmarensis]|uniref:YhdT family protein n=1 Tax=Alkalihalophilus marmarensis TaxID=521377 RepID=UPI00203AB8DB|nr:YhdT family protein [Alkalihalophilus marmarensis]MCM3490110.1 YhdT family protein [Alkalihalophilus marmarensis]